jgi:hypothetical protein
MTTSQGWPHLHTRAFEELGGAEVGGVETVEVAMLVTVVTVLAVASSITVHWERQGEPPACSPNPY